jgi:CPA1 family monovalent cation:H+ antiporter
MSVSEIGLILLVACVVAMLSRRLNLPYSVGLVVAGFGMALIGEPAKLNMSPDFIYSVLLPPLIFEAALQLKWKPFHANLPVSLTLALPGSIIGAAVVAFGMHWISGWTWNGAALFGALIAATDPVAVIAIFKELRVEPRLSLLVESESLLNDGVAAVGFSIIGSVSSGADASVLSSLSSFGWMVGGGLVVGSLVSGALLLLAGRTEDRLVEITLTTIAAYGSFLGAEHLHMSGVLASLTAGLIVGNVGWRGSISESGRSHVIAFWEYAAFLSNSVVFILIGGHEGYHVAQLFSGAAALAIVFVLLGRAVAVYGLCPLFSRTSLSIDARYQHVLFWGGLRGALALALALSTPESIAEKHDIIVVTFAVVAFSIFAQGLTMGWLVEYLQLRAQRTDPPEA